MSILMGSLYLSTVAILLSLQGLVSQDLTEEHVPLRFLFLHIGPDDETIDYHEVGRAMATLMSDAVSLNSGTRRYHGTNNDNFTNSEHPLVPRYSD